jgi:cobaltochelatase CobT
MENNADRLILDRHLRSVIEAIEKEDEIGLLAVGVRHDAARYYRAARVIEKAEALGAAVFSALDRIFD